MKKDQAAINIENFLRASTRPLLVILGPTASGKTALSLEIAKQFNGEIISADSRQVYKFMDIGTDKIPFEKREGIPHHLLDVAEPSERFTLAHYKEAAEKIIDEIHARGKLPMLVGGTGLYIRAVAQNFALPPEDPLIRAQLNEELRGKGATALHEKLQKLDPENAAKISPKNAPYIVRALEIFMATGEPKRDKKNPPRYECLSIGLQWPMEVLLERINRRVDEQMSRGLVDEVKKILNMGYSKNLPSLRTLGYREVMEYLEAAINLEAVSELIKKNTHNFAKRQITWFKKDEGIRWITSS